MVLILEENNAFLRELLRYYVPALNVRNLLDYRIVKEARGKNGAQDAMDVLVDLVLGNLPALDGFLQRVTEKVLTGLFLVEACVGGFGGGMGTTPIGEHKALEVKILLQDFREQVGVFASIVAIHPVVGTHEGAGI